MAQDKEPVDWWPEYRFPWGWILLALGASSLLGIVAWEYFVYSGLQTTLLAVGGAGLAYALYHLHRAARHEQALRVPESAVSQAVLAQAILRSRLQAEDGPRSSRAAP